MTAAVVGVILNLAVWFSEHVLYPAPGRPDFYAMILAAVFSLGLWRAKRNVISVVIAGGLLGLAGKLLFGS